MKDFSSWDELIGAFREIGGVADNVVVGNGPYGRGIFAKDPTRPVRLYAPANLLLPIDECELDGDDLLVRANSSLAPEVQDFWNRYNRFTSWSGGGRESCKEFLSGMQALPHHAQEMLRTEFSLGSFLVGPTPEAVMGRFIQTRAIRQSSSPTQQMLMPVLDLINHAPGPATFDFSAGAAFEGKVESEVLALYSNTDSWGFFCNHGIATMSRFAFSEPYSSTKDSVSIIIKKMVKWYKSREDKLPSPILSKSGNNAELSFIILGDRSDPLTPMIIFRDVAEEILGADVQNYFEHILLLNRVKFHKLLAATEDSDRPLARIIHRACRLQLETLACCIAGVPRKSLKKKRNERRHPQARTALSASG